jgi:hypothetical protein
VPPKKKTRRGSRGGRGRKKKPAAAGNGQVEAPAAVLGVPTIHVPDASIGEEAAVNGSEPGTPRKKTRRGTRGGRRRRKPADAARAEAQVETGSDQS